METRLGIHARPAAELVKTARANPQVEVKVFKEGEGAEATSILSLIALGINQGDRIIIRVNGEDEQRVLGEILTLLNYKT